MLKTIFWKVFHSGSRTYFYSSLFFPPRIRDQVFQLYGFVRTADDLVDSVPQKKAEFLDFKNLFYQLRSEKSNFASTQEMSAQEGSYQEFIINFLELEHTLGFDPAWADAFLESMEMDLHKKTYLTLAETEKYIYGSAEVIGLFMAKIMGLDSQSYPYAQMLGKSMQYINFIRDIAEDVGLGRIYFPQTDLHRFGLNGLHFNEIKDKQKQLENFIRSQIDRYLDWQIEAEKGYQYIPKRYRIPIKTAADMYNWTAREIAKNPSIVYAKKIKPRKRQIMFDIVLNSLQKV